MERLGISLSGGGARGIAHLGVLKALEEHEMKPEVMIGTSAGALVGALYGSGIAPEEVLEIVSQTPLIRYFKPSFSFQGLLSSEGLIDELGKHLPSDRFEDLQYKLIVNCVDLYTGKSVFFDSGSLRQHVAASAAVPVLYEPIRRGEHVYVDGGLLNNMPIVPLIEHACTTKIGVHTNPYPKLTPTKGMRHTLEKTMILIIQNNIRPHQAAFDLFIEPQKLSQFGIFEVKKAREIFEIGYKSAKEKLKNSGLI